MVSVAHARDCIRGSDALRPALDSHPMGLRICLVTPFSWSRRATSTSTFGARRRRSAAPRPHRHDRRALVAGKDLLDGRRALQSGVSATSSRSARPCARRGASASACRSACGPTSRRPRARLVRRRPRVRAGAAEPLLDRAARGGDDGRGHVPLDRADRGPAPQEPASEVPRARRRPARNLGGGDRARDRAFPGRLRAHPPRCRHRRVLPCPKRRLIVVELAPGQSAIAKSVLRLLKSLPDWEVLLGRTAPMTRRPTIPASVRQRAHVRSLVKPDARRTVLGEAAIFVPAPGGSCAAPAEARSCGCAIAEPAGVAAQPELAAAAVGRLSRTATSAEGRRRDAGAGARGGLRPPRRAPRADLRERLEAPPLGADSPTRGRRPAGRSRAGSSSTCTCTRTGRTTARSTRRP